LSCSQLLVYSVAVLGYYLRDIKRVMSNHNTIWSTRHDTRRSRESDFSHTPAWATIPVTVYHAMPPDIILIYTYFDFVRQIARIVWYRFHYYYSGTRRPHISPAQGVVKYIPNLKQKTKYYAESYNTSFTLEYLIT